MLRRTFGTTPERRFDLSRLYDKITGWRKSTPKPESRLVDPTKQREDAAREEMPEDSEPRHLKMLGKPRNMRQDWPLVKKFAEFSAFPTNHHRRDLTASAIADAVAAAFPDGNATDIAKRFAGVVQVQKQLGVAVPDAVLTRITTPAELEEHLQSVARPYDEKQPDAIYLDPAEFVGTNITVSDPQAERKARKQRYRQLLADARKAQEKRAEELLQTAPQ